MPPTWQVVLRDIDGAVVATFDQWIEWVLTRAVNGVGSYGLHLDGDDSRISLLEEDCQFEFWYTDPENSIAWRKEFEAFHGDYDWYTDKDGARHYISMGRGYNDLLDRTINESQAGTAGSAKSGAAESVIKEYVDEQAGPSAGVRARSGLTIQADAATGNTINLQRSYRNLLEICQDVARIGGGDFQIVGTHAGQSGPATFEFRWYDGQLGTDRRTTVVFSEELGNMSEPTLKVRRSHVRNAALVGAYGEGASRYITWRTDAASFGSSPWGRREVFVDAREVDDGNTDAVEDKGDAVLAENAAGRTFTFVAVQSPGCLYGRDYFLGDLVTARHLGVDYYRKIVGVTIQSGRMGHTTTIEMIEMPSGGEGRWLAPGYLSSSMLASAFLEGSS